jgi:hypothetical protein
MMVFGSSWCYETAFRWRTFYIGLAVALLDRLPRWQRVHADNVAVVHKRRADASA